MTDPRGAERRIEGAIIRGGAQRDHDHRPAAAGEPRGERLGAYRSLAGAVIQSEFADGFGTLAELGRRSVFSGLPGSTAMIRSTRWPSLATKLVGAGPVITGGGPGVMEAANKGAAAAGGGRSASALSCRSSRASTPTSISASTCYFSPAKPCSSSTPGFRRHAGRLRDLRRAI